MGERSSDLELMSRVEFFFQTEVLPAITSTQHFRAEQGIRYLLKALDPLGGASYNWVWMLHSSLRRVFDPESGVLNIYALENAKAGCAQMRLNYRVDSNLIPPP